MSWDAIVIGTGFGGSVAAHRLAQSHREARTAAPPHHRADGDALPMLQNDGVNRARTDATQDPGVAEPADLVAAALPVTDRRAWLLLTAVALLIVAGLVWTIFGRAPETISGPGMIVPTGGFVDVGTGLAGTVSDVLVDPGQSVQAGTPLVALLTPSGGTVKILASVDGVIATIVAKQGGITDPGSPILTIDPDAGGNVAVAFLPAEQAARVRTGMPALVALASMPESQYGYITGTITAVSRLPVTADRVMLLVGGNEQLPSYFMSSGLVVEVKVTLDEDPANPTGYEWTIGHGPDTQVTTGTLADVTVVLSDASPFARIAR